MEQTNKQDLKLYMANDWDLVEETPEYYVLKRNEASLGGHVLTFMLTIWWTFGIGNVVYHLISRKNKKLLK